MFSDFDWVGVSLFSLAGLAGIAVIGVHIFDVRRHKSTRDRLAGILQTGTSLFHEQIPSRDQYPDWEHRFEEWHQDVSDWFENEMSWAHRVRFLSIRVQGATIQYRHRVSGDHNGHLNLLLALLTYLGALFDQRESQTF